MPATPGSVQLQVKAQLEAAGGRDGALHQVRRWRAESARSHDRHAHRGGDRDTPADPEPQAGFQEGLRAEGGRTIRAPTSLQRDAELTEELQPISGKPERLCVGTDRENGLPTV